LIEQNRSLDQVHIGCDDATEGQFNNVAAHQVSRWHRLPLSVAPNRRIQGEPRFQGLQGGLGMALLKIGKARIKNEEAGDDGSL
jgi:hypothetical protein